MQQASDTHAADYIASGAGVRLRVVAAAADGPAAVGTAIIATGRGECCEKYLDCASALRALHLNTVVFDWRGQGLSTRALPNRHKGHVDSFDEFIGDLEGVVAHAQALYGDGPMYILAHSTGGQVALRTMARRPEMFRAAILSAPMVDIARGRFQSWLFGAVSFVATRVGLGHAYIPGTGNYGPRDADFARNKVTHDPVRFAFFHDAIAANPDLAVGGPTWGWVRAALRSIGRVRAEAAAGHITTDILIVSAGADRVVSNQAQMDLVRHLPNGELVSIPGAWHEILQETPPVRTMFWEHAKAFLARIERRGDTISSAPSIDRLAPAPLPSSSGLIR